MVSRLALDPASAHAALSRLTALVDELTSAAERVHATEVDPRVAGVASAAQPWPAAAEWIDPKLAARRDALASGIARSAADLAQAVVELRHYVERMTGHDDRVAARVRALEVSLGDATP